MNVTGMKQMVEEGASVVIFQRPGKTSNVTPNCIIECRVDQKRYFLNSFRETENPKLFTIAAAFRYIRRNMHYDGPVILEGGRYA